jgi:hypothetical protein
MTRIRFSSLGIIALTVVLAHLTAAWSQGPRPASRSKTAPGSLESKPAENSDLTCRVYALKDLGDDPGLGRWIAETIPQVIQPGTWNLEDTTSAPRGLERGHKLCYYSQGKVLVVYHCAAVQTEVSAFLDSVKKALPPLKDGVGATQACTPRADSMVMPATWMAPRSMRPLEGVPASQTSSYPVPAPLAQPKHLVHLILRAEGIGDLGATGLIKDLTEAPAITEAGKDPPKGPAATEAGKDPPKPEAAAVPPLNPSFTLIFRYEGEGIIDNTVADVLKEIYGPKNAGQNGVSGCIAPSCLGTCLGNLIGAPSRCVEAPPTPKGAPSPQGPVVPSPFATPTQPPQGPPRPTPGDKGDPLSGAAAAASAGLP